MCSFLLKIGTTFCISEERLVQRLLYSFFYGIQVRHKVKTKQSDVTALQDGYSELKNEIGTFCVLLLFRKFYGLFL
jgi:hypothetical protein